MHMTGDRSRLYTVALAASWIVCVALPLAASEWLRRPFSGLPLFGVLLWFLALRLARVKRYREDKRADDADDMEAVRRIFSAQGGRAHAAGGSTDAERSDT